MPLVNLTTPSLDSEVEAVFKKVFKRPDLQISRSMNSFDIPGWSSLLHVRVLVALEEHFQISFLPEEIVMVKNIGDLMGLVESKRKKAG